MWNNAGKLLVILGVLGAWGYTSNKEDNWDSLKTPAELVGGYGYAYEEHKPITKDGYILTMMRIPCSLYIKRTRRRPIFLMHGSFDNSMTWLIKDHDGLAITLARNGYDVWMGNNRGNLYSHEHLDKEKHNWKEFWGEFWDFTYDQFALQDLPTMIQYIQDVTGYTKIDYIGHSQGTTQFFALCTIRTEWINENIRSFIGLAPVVIVDYKFSPIVIFFMHLPTKIMKFMKIKNFLVIPGAGYILQLVCRIIPNIIYDLIPFTWGTPTHMNMKRMGVLGKNEPGGTSVNNMEHWIQLLTGSPFQMYDMGQQPNLRRYGSLLPPLYPLHKLMLLTFPIYLIRGTADSVLTQGAFMHFITYFPSLYLKYMIINGYCHVDYLWAIDAYLQLYLPILNYYDHLLRNEESALNRSSKEATFS